MRTDNIDAVIGVDAHADTHSASLVSPLATELAYNSVPATGARPSAHAGQFLQETHGPQGKSTAKLRSGNLAQHVDKRIRFCHYVIVRTITDEQAAARRTAVLTAARWCFLNFGFAKTTFSDIGERAGLSRTLLYRIFEDKEDIYRAVFVDWLISRRPIATEIAKGAGSAHERLVAVCHLLVLEPWAEMVGAPMGSVFLNICEKIDPESEALYRRVTLECVTIILGDDTSAEVFLLALGGLFADHPSSEVLERRTQLLASRFASPTNP